MKHIIVFGLFLFASLAAFAQNQNFDPTQAVTACTVTNGTILGTTVTTAPAGTVLLYKYYTSASTWIRFQ